MPLSKIVDLVLVKQGARNFILLTNLHTPPWHLESLWGTENVGFCGLGFPARNTPDGAFSNAVTRKSSVPRF